MGQNTTETTPLEKRIEVLSANYDAVKKEVRQLTNDAERNKSAVNDLRLQNKKLREKVDSLGKVTDSITGTQNTDRNNFSNRLKNTNSSIASSQSAIASRTTWGIVAVAIIIVLLLAVGYILLRRMKKGASSIETTIDEVRKAQDTLQSTQTKLQEDSVKLYNKLLEIAQRQLDDKKKQPVAANAAPDHSLALKVADEIARIEMNMARMDPTVKGLKHLKKAVERMKDNFKANGYEIADMLGKPYNEGMRVNPDFVIDETLQTGERIITGVTKPQVLYNGELIQKATIKVSQNI